MGQFERDCLDTFFERDGDGFLYYPRPWSGGVRVSAEEREAYLGGAVSVFNLWNWAVGKRPAEAPPRPWKHRRRRQAQSPLGKIGPFEIFLGAGLFLTVLADQAMAGRLLWGLLSLLLLGDGLVNCYFRWGVRRP